MAKRSRKRSVKKSPEKTVNAVPVSAASPVLLIELQICGNVKQVSTEIKLPCTLAEFTYELIERIFPMAEELAFANNIEFSEAPPLETVEAPKDDTQESDVSETMGNADFTSEKDYKKARALMPSLFEPSKTR